MHQFVSPHTLHSPQPKGACCKHGVERFGVAVTLSWCDGYYLWFGMLWQPALAGQVGYCHLACYV